MILFPAIDLRHGCAVRLQQGNKNKSTVYDKDPVKRALHWQALGAKWLHIINLDGAFDEQTENFEIIKKISQTVAIPVQAGGGIRSLDSCAQLLENGVSRLIIGTVALEQPSLYREMCQTFPGKIGVSLDAKDGLLKTHGWEKATQISLEDIIPELEEAGTAFIIYTDISRDGMHTGVNLTTLSKLLTLSSIPVIAAGGISDMSDIKEVFELGSSGSIQGIVCGKSIYDKTLNFKEAQMWIDEHTQSL